MQKLITRPLACLMIFCLLADPCFSAIPAITPSRPPDYSAIFLEEALVARARYSSRQLIAVIAGLIPAGLRSLLQRTQPDGVGSSTVKLSSQEKQQLQIYTQEFLAQHASVVKQNARDVVQALIDPAILSIPLQPHPQTLTQSKAQWIENYLHEFSKYHLAFLNEMNPDIRRKCFTAKLLEGEREKAIREFLAANQRFAASFPIDRNRTLGEQGVVVSDIRDFSSGRGTDFGAPVYRISLEKANGVLVLFLKGYGTSSIQRYKDGLQRQKFEEFFYRAATLLGMPSVAARYVSEMQDPAMMGYTLMESISGSESGGLFEGLSPSKSLKSEFHAVSPAILEGFARWAALNDLFNAGDRAVVKSRDEQYPTNYMVDVPKLKAGDWRAIMSVDHVYLFNPAENEFLLNDLRVLGHAEIRVVSSLIQAQTPEGLDRLLAEFERHYLAQWENIKKEREALSHHVIASFGRDSEEYRTFAVAMAGDPVHRLARQKQALLEFQRSRITSVLGETVSSPSSNPRSENQHGFRHGPVTVTTDRIGDAVVRIASVDSSAAHITLEVDPTILEYDFSRYATFSKKGRIVKPWFGRSLREWIQGDRSILAAINGGADNLTCENSLLVSGGRLIQRALPGVHAETRTPLNGRYSFFSLDAGQLSIFDIELRDGKATSPFPFRNAISGAVLIRAGKDRSADVQQAMPNTQQNEVAWNPRTQRLALSILARDRDGRLLLTAVAGQTNESTDPTLKETVDYLMKLGVTDAIYLGASADVQQYIRDTDRPLLSAGPRRGSSSAAALQEGRPLFTVLTVRDINAASSKRKFVSSLQWFNVLAGKRRNMGPREAAVGAAHQSTFGFWNLISAAWKDPIRLMMEEEAPLFVDRMLRNQQGLRPETRDGISRALQTTYRIDPVGPFVARARGSEGVVLGALFFNLSETEQRAVLWHEWTHQLCRLGYTRSEDAATAVGMIRLIELSREKGLPVQSRIFPADAYKGARAVMRRLAKNPALEKGLRRQWLEDLLVDRAEDYSTPHAGSDPENYKRSTHLGVLALEFLDRPYGGDPQGVMYQYVADIGRGRSPIESFEAMRERFPGDVASSRSKHRSDWPDESEIGSAPSSNVLSAKQDGKEATSTKKKLQHSQRFRTMSLSVALPGVAALLSYLTQTTPLETSTVIPAALFQLAATLVLWLGLDWVNLANARLLEENPRLHPFFQSMANLWHLCLPFVAGHEAAHVILARIFGYQVQAIYFPTVRDWRDPLPPPGVRFQTTAIAPLHALLIAPIGWAFELTLLATALGFTTGGLWADIDLPLRIVALSIGLTGLIMAGITLAFKRKLINPTDKSWRGWFTMFKETADWHMLKKAARELAGTMGPPTMGAYFGMGRDDAKDSENLFEELAKILTQVRDRESEDEWVRSEQLEFIQFLLDEEKDTQQWMGPMLDLARRLVALDLDGQQIRGILTEILDSDRRSIPSSIERVSQITPMIPEQKIRRDQLEQSFKNARQNQSFANSIVQILPMDPEQHDGGSGVVIGEDEGYYILLTNSHVVFEDTEVRVQTSGMPPRMAGTAAVVLKSRSNAREDLAVLVLKKMDLQVSGLRPIPIQWEYNQGDIAVLVSGKNETVSTGHLISSGEHAALFGGHTMEGDSGSPYLMGTPLDPRVVAIHKNNHPTGVQLTRRLLQQLESALYAKQPHGDIFRVSMQDLEATSAAEKFISDLYHTVFNQPRRPPLARMDVLEKAASLPFSNPPSANQEPKETASPQNPQGADAVIATNAKLQPVIVLVEDTAPLLQSLQWGFEERFGKTHEIMTAKSAKEGWHLIQSLLSQGRTIAVVVTDNDMPDNWDSEFDLKNEGTQLASRVSTIAPGVPILIQTVTPEWVALDIKEVYPNLIGKVTLQEKGTEGVVRAASKLLSPILSVLLFAGALALFYAFGQKEGIKELSMFGGFSLLSGPILGLIYKFVPGGSIRAFEHLPAEAGTLLRAA